MATKEVIRGLKSLLEDMWEAMRSQSTTRKKTFKELKAEICDLKTRMASLDTQNRTTALGKLKINLQAILNTRIAKGSNPSDVSTNDLQ